MGRIFHKQQLVGTSGNVRNYWKNYSQQLSKETRSSLDKIIYHRKTCTKTSLPSFSLLFPENSRFSSKETRCLEHSEEDEPPKSDESNERCFSSHLRKKNWRKPYSIESRSKKKTKKRGPHLSCHRARVAPHPDSSGINGNAGPSECKVVWNWFALCDCRQ